MCQYGKWDELLNRNGLFIVFLLCGFLIFAIPVFLIDPYRMLYMTAVAVVFLVSYLWARKRGDLQEYLQVLLAFFIASLAFLLQIYWSAGDTVEGIVSNKLISTLIVVITILLFVWITSRDLSTLYLKKGNIRLGAIIGVLVTVAFVVTAIPASIWLFGGQEVTMERLLSLIPWIAAFVLLNGVKEELLFRGLFLKKYESFFSIDRANLLQAVVFASAHLQATIDTFAIILFVLTLFLGLGFGAVMQKTDSLFGSVLCHAAADVPVILAVFSYL